MFSSLKTGISDLLKVSARITSPGLKEHDLKLFLGRRFKQMNNSFNHILKKISLLRSGMA